MPRRSRAGSAGLVFHLLNRAAHRATLFASDRDYEAFEALIGEARLRTELPLLAYTLMPTHFHLVVWPRQDHDVSEFMRWLTLTHTMRWHARRQSVGTGPLFQGRFKSFPMQHDEHFLRVCRYVERNAMRAGLCERSEDWRWSSLKQRCSGCSSVKLDPWAVPQPDYWVRFVNQAQTNAELEAIRRSVRRGAPFGDECWVEATARALKLEPRIRPLGRPLASMRTSGDNLLSSVD